ncbi:MAG: NAD+ synthase [Burkholderiaceae bacterium]|jgi:NAD+ synthase (glutamine-hydrolysing)|nr:NAD+ synthase [Burkholderiaceae bacterium]
MSSKVKVAVAQLNCTVGDFEGNSRKIVDAARQAAAGGAHVLLTPELSLTGYPPEDLLLRRAFYAATDAALQKLCAQLLQFPEMKVVVGHPMAREGRRFNAASLVAGGMVLGTYCKHDLPNYDVFDEQRYFTPDNRPFVFEANGTSFGINICEDTWFPYAPECAQAAGAQVLLVLNGSPFHLGKQQQRLQIMRTNVCRFGLAAVYANLAGGQDELVFDGASFVLDAGGGVTAAAPHFDEALLLVDFVDGVPQPGAFEPQPAQEALAYSALVLGVRDYVGKNGFPGALIGLSGGVDSALTLAVAVDALGPERVRAVMMPSQYTAQMSLDDAAQLAENLGVRCDVLPIKPAFDAFLATLAREFRGLPWDTTEENLQARIRGTLLMALSNKYGSIVLTTGNKSETAVGYSTLYGDLAGGFAVIKDILKTLVYRLCRYRNGVSPVIPERILTRAPSAELKPDQKDQDSLPPYDVLDRIIELYMQEGLAIPDIVAAGLDEAVVRRVVRMIRLSEYKRRQSPVGIRVTHRGFGRDWRYPITNRFREESA